MRVVILGAGGHGAVVAECVRAANQLEPLGFLDDDAALHGKQVLGLPVLGAIGALDALPAEAEGVLLAVGNNRSRVALLGTARARGVDRPVVVHPRAWVSPSAQLAAGTVVVGGAVINARALVGPACIINTCASVDHDCVLGEGVHVAPGARLAGGVRVGARSFIGMGAMVIEGVSIGEGCLVAAGAVVLRNTLPGERVAGVPARPMPIGDSSRNWDTKR
jgi:sugar O-acyltransferase (sialic acid O-acetyltransferase NeuD family)